MASRRSRRSHGHGHGHHPLDRTRSHRHARYEEEPHPAGFHNDPVCPAPSGLPRRHTDNEVALRDLNPRPHATRSKSDACVDLDLAYGEYHSPNRAAQPPQPPQIENEELNGLVGRTQWLLEEANCVYHSATKTIDHLQKNPEAMAAVALTLAEISNLISKMAPSVVLALKSAAPAVFSLLVSPQFLIAAGVGIGVTIVMFGGYKIIKQICSGDGNTNNAGRGGAAAAAAPSGNSPNGKTEEMLEIDTERLSQVEMWRRGVADIEAVSVGTSVDGEFITPTAAAMSGIDVSTARMCGDPRFKFSEETGSRVSSSHRSRRRHSRTKSRSKGAKDEAKTAPSDAPVKGTSRFFSKTSSRVGSKSETHRSEREKKPKEKIKKSNRLRLMFTA